ncbi:unnamed protein product [Caenorhabditis bovis]|uniref:Uncharacterized protein n=1 Tax=Caenorhabditis bovis TaxID=2654633 RepID=A0A8S1FA43_9PELO|nr:unnamed protein product [Caenorhabditis bovis]
MRGSSSYATPPHGQMIINMKTTVTTSGGAHNGLVVHSAIQSSSSSSSANPSTSGGPSDWRTSPYVESPAPIRKIEDRIEMIRSNSSLHRERSSSPLPIQMVPSTSRETVYSGKRDSSPNVPAAPPSPPASPIYSFKGRNSPPDEFIQPTKLMLNVFNPTHREAPAWQTSIPRNQVTTTTHDGGIQLSRREALLNDAVTTTTTVEVFRAPLDETPIVSLPPPPYGGQPLLIRTHGPSYERWGNTRTQTTLADEPLHSNSTSKGVQWKETLVENRRYLNGDNDYDEILPPPPPPMPNPHTYYHHPQSQYSPISHPIITHNSREDLSKPMSRASAYQAPTSQPPRTLSPLYIVPDRKQQQMQQPQNHQMTSPSYRSNYGSRESLNSGYYDIDRSRDSGRHSSHRRSDDRHPRRSKSNTRDEASSMTPQGGRRYKRSSRHRSMSPMAGRASNYGGSQEFVIPAHSPIGSTLMLASPDPNELPGRPASAKSAEIFALYQTRDALNRVVDQLDRLMESVIDELEMITSPLAESEDSVISEASHRHDCVRSCVLEARRPMRNSMEIDDDGGNDKEIDEIYDRPPPLPEKDYARISQFYRKRTDEFNMRRSRSFDKSRNAPPRPRTPSRNARHFVDRKKETLYATPKKIVEIPKIEEFKELPKYVKNDDVTATTSTSTATIDMSTEQEFNSSSDKVKKVEQQLTTLRLAREDSLTNLLKRHLSQKAKTAESTEETVEEELTPKLPEYVEPKDPIVKELQEFLNIAPKTESKENEKYEKASSSPTISTSSTIV